MAVDDLKNCANTDSDRGYDESPLSSQLRGEWPDDETTKEGAGLKYRNAVRIDLRLLFLGVPEVALE